MTHESNVCYFIWLRSVNCDDDDVSESDIPHPDDQQRTCMIGCFTDYSMAAKKFQSLTPEEGCAYDLNKTVLNQLQDSYCENIDSKKYEKKSDTDSTISDKEKFDEWDSYDDEDIGEGDFQHDGVPGLGEYNGTKVFQQEITGFVKHV